MLGLLMVASFSGDPNYSPQRARFNADLWGSLTLLFLSLAALLLLRFGAIVNALLDGMPPNKSLDRNCGSVFRIKHGAEEVASIRDVRSTLTKL